MVGVAGVVLSVTILYEEAEVAVSVNEGGEGSVTMRREDEDVLVVGHGLVVLVLVVVSGIPVPVHVVLVFVSELPVPITDDSLVGVVLYGAPVLEDETAVVVCVTMIVVLSPPGRVEVYV